MVYAPLHRRDAPNKRDEDRLADELDETLFM